MLHIKDLQTKAEMRVQELDPNITVSSDCLLGSHWTGSLTLTQMGHLLHVAEQSTKGAENLLEYRRPDLAYVEYLCAMEIVTKLIPRHKDAVVLHHDRGTMHRLNKDLAKVCMPLYFSHAIAYSN